MTHCSNCNLQKQLSREIFSWPTNSLTPALSPTLLHIENPSELHMGMFCFLSFFPSTTMRVSVRLSVFMVSNNFIIKDLHLVRYWIEMWCSYLF